MFGMTFPPTEKEKTMTKPGNPVADGPGANTEELPGEVRRECPEESEELGAWGAGCEFCGSTPEPATLLRHFHCTRDELGILANYYLNDANDQAHFWEWAQQYSGSARGRENFAWDRLKTIRQFLGEDEFEQATAATRKKWDEKFETLAAMPPCESCGMKHDPEQQCPGARSEKA